MQCKNPVHTICLYILIFLSVSAVFYLEQLMNFYFSTRHIPALKGLPLAERVKRLDQAAKKLTVPEKTLLNVLKLLVIVPVFVLILQTASNWTSLLWALLVFLLYPLLVKPIQNSMSAKYLAPAPEKENA